jgi:hypothetical protein
MGGEIIEWKAMCEDEFDEAEKVREVMNDG